MSNTIVRRKTKLELAIAVINLEKRGFECLSPIHEVSQLGKDWDRDSHNNVRYKGTHSSSYWRAIMKKVD